MIMFCLLVSSTFTMMSGAIIAPCLPQIEKMFYEIEFIALLVKLILSLPALLTAIFAPIFGVLANRLGKKNILLSSLFLYALSGSSAYYLNDIYSILIGRALLGISVAGLISMSSSLIADYYEGETRNKILGLQAAFMGFGGVVFISLSGVVADLKWSYPFLIYLLSIVVLCISIRNLHEPTIEEDCTDNKLVRVNKNDKLFDIYILIFIAIMFFYMIPIQLPFILSGIAGVSNSMIGIAISSMNLSAAAISVSYKKITSRYTVKSIYLILLCFMAIGYLGIGFANHYYEIIISCIISGFGIGLLMPLGNIWIVSRVNTANRSKSIGYLNTAIYLGQFLSPIILEPIIKILDIRLSFIMVSIIMILMVAFLKLFKYV